MEQEITANSEGIIKHLFHISEPSLFSWFKDKALEPSLLEEINNINEFFPFIPLMFVTNKQVSAIAIQKVSELLTHIPACRLAGFDESLRKFSHPNFYEAFSKYWYHLQPSLLEKIDCNTLTPIKILCCHLSGYVRFNAIKILVEISIEEAIPFLILRANDWVDEIRVFCQGILLEVIDDKNVCFVILEYLPLVKQLIGKGRYDQIQLTRKIELNLLSFIAFCMQHFRKDEYNLKY